MLSIRARKLMMLALLAAFGVQTWLVYADDTGRRTPPLSNGALDGSRVWHRHNCQSCHQLHGFGGFLGPDLTNVSPRLTRERLASVLTQGTGSMPAFHLPQRDIDAIEAFLREIDLTGVGQARTARHTRASLSDIVNRMRQAGDAGKAPARGAVLFDSTCASCHRLGSDNRVGSYLAPDLLGAARRLGDVELTRVLTTGRPDKGMPPPALDDAARCDLVELLKWLEQRDETVRRELAPPQGALPWFEYP